MFLIHFMSYMYQRMYMLIIVAIYGPDMFKKCIRPRSRVDECAGMTFGAIRIPCVTLLMPE